MMKPMAKIFEKTVVTGALTVLMSGVVACGEAPAHDSVFVDESQDIRAQGTSYDLNGSVAGDDLFEAEFIEGVRAADDAKLVVQKIHGGITTPELGQMQYKKATTEKERGIPEHYPDLLGEEAATFELQLGTKKVRLVSYDLSFQDNSEDSPYILDVANEYVDAAMKLTVSHIDPSQQVGAGKDPKPAFKLNIDDTLWTNISNGECYPSVVLDITGKSHLALWGRIKGSLCDGETSREFAGTFAALKPGIRALQ